MIESLSKIIKISGPGLLFASTAIGVSHLIQSTRAGADFAFRDSIQVNVINGAVDTR